MFCPHMERFNSDCDKVLTFRNLSYAMKLCTSDYERCPIYIKLQQAQTRVPRKVLVPRTVA